MAEFALSTTEQTIYTRSFYVKSTSGSDVYGYYRLYGYYEMNAAKTTATVHIRMTIWNSSGYSWGGTCHWQCRDDTGDTTRWDSSYTTRSNIPGSETQVGSWSYTISDSSGVNALCFMGAWTDDRYSDTYNSWLYIPGSAFASAPTGLTTTIAEIMPTGVKFNTSVSSWGTEGTETDRYFENALMDHGSPYGSPYCYTHGTHGISAGVTETIEVSTANHNSLSSITTIAPNTQYYYGAWARNQSDKQANIIPGTVVTLAEALSVKSVLSVTSNSVTISYTTTADGGYYSKNIQYSLDNSTWVTGATVSAAAATSGTFTITGLTPDTTYTILLRVSTTETGATSSGSLTATTLAIAKLYGSVNGQAKQVKKLYGSVNGVAREITKIYGSVNGVAKRVF